MGKTAPAKSSHTLHDSHRDECNVCDALAGTQQGKEHWLMQCHPGCTQNGEGGNVNVGFSTMDFGDGKWSVRKMRFLRMVCLFETVFLTLGGTSLAPIYFSVTS